MSDRDGRRTEVCSPPCSKKEKDANFYRQFREGQPLKRWLRAVRDRMFFRQSIAQAVTIADASEPLLWDRVRESIFEMDLPEARGYVRARAAAVIRRQTEQVLGHRHQLSDRTLRRIEQLATERVTHLVLLELLASGEQARRLAA